jgi:hypothetical protein
MMKACCGRCEHLSEKVIKRYGKVLNDRYSCWKLFSGRGTVSKRQMCAKFYPKRMVKK